MVTQAFNLSTHETEAGGWISVSEPSLHSVCCSMPSQTKSGGLTSKNINMEESHRKIHIRLTSSICMHTHRQTDKHTHEKEKGKDNFLSSMEERNT